MSTWNVRILHAYYPSDGSHEFFAAEVYYSDDKAKTPTSWCNFSMSSDTIKGLLFYTDEVKNAMTKPILESTDLTKTYTP